MTLFKKTLKIRIGIKNAKAQQKVSGIHGLFFLQEELDHFH